MTPSDIPSHTLPADWTCPVCSATHAQPALACRRCGASLPLFARLAVGARALRAAGREDEAAALSDPR